MQGVVRFGKKSKSRIRDVGGKQGYLFPSLTNSEILVPKMLLQLYVKIGCWQLRRRKKILLFYANQQGMREAVMSGKDKIFKDKFAKKFQRQQPLL